MTALRHPQKGRFIVLEGGEGAGKTTHAAFLAQSLREKGLTVTLTREPGGTPLAEKLRDLIVGESGAGLHRLTEMALFMAARHDHITRRILPALEAGEWVICDRYKDSTYAYQVCGWGASLETLTHFEALFQFPEPDYTLLFDVPPACGLERACSRGPEAQNRYERLGLDFHERVRQGFLAKAQEGGSHKGYTLFDAMKPLDTIQQDLKAWLSQALEKAQCP